jgi:hypothetical protein
VLGGPGRTGKVRVSLKIVSVEGLMTPNLIAWRGSQYLNGLVKLQYFIPTNEPELDGIYELPSPPSIPSPSHNRNVPEESAPSSTASHNEQSPTVAPAPNSIPATTSTSTDIGTAATHAGADATDGPKINSDPTLNTRTNPKVDSSDPNTNLNLNTHPDAEIDSHLLLHPEVVPHLISAFKLSSVAGADILTAIEQAKARIRKERKKQRQREKEAHGPGQEKKS